MRYRDADTNFLAVLQEYEDALDETLATTAYPQAYHVMSGLCARTNSLKAAMLDVLESGNAYAFKTLHRCLCEHYLKFLYIWVRFTHERSDTVGRDYYRFCGAREMHQGLAALEVAGPLVGSAVISDLHDVLHELYPDAARITTEALYRQSDKFTWHLVLESLTGKDMAELTKDLPFLAHVIQTYIRLTPFVHSGPHPDIDTLDASELQVRRECVDDAGTVVLLPAVMLMLTSVAISAEYPEYSRIAITVYRLIKKYVTETSGAEVHRHE